MAVIYSLICFGGRTGKVVTFTDAGDVVNLALHGLRDGAGVRFSTTGSLPTGLTANTAYYAKLGADSGKFTLWTTQALTTQVTFTGTGTGTHTVFGEYFKTLTSGQLSRYGSAGSERIYDGLSSWNTARAGASALDKEVCEIGEAWSDSNTATVSISVPAGETLITTMVNGARSTAYHFGKIPETVPVRTDGYIKQQAAQGNNNTLQLSKPRTTVDGFIIKIAPGGGYSPNGLIMSGVSVASRMLVLGRFDGSGSGISMNGQFCRASDCVAAGWSAGFNLPNYVYGISVYNSTSVLNTYGFYSAIPSTTFGFYYGNISVGNTTSNWTASVAFDGASNNAGLTTEAWMSAGGSRVTIAMTDFVNTSGTGSPPYDFRAVNSSSPQVETGVLTYGADFTDLAYAMRPNYMNGAAAYSDIGAYEFDHGYGLEPASTTVAFTGVNAGSEIRVYDAAGSELAGVESCDPDHVLTWTVSASAVTVRIVHTAYKIKEFQYTNVAGTVSLPIQQEPDTWYSNP